MKRTVLIGLVGLICLSLAGCKHDTFTVEGTIEGGAGHTLWLEEIAPEGTLFIDSIPVDSKGRFMYKYKMPYQSLYNLHTTEGNYAVLLPNYGERIHVEGNYDNLSMTYSVSGSPESILLWQLQQFSNDGNLALTQLIDTTAYYQALLAEGAVDEATVAAKKEMTDSIYRQLFSEQQDYMCRFIEENQGSLSTLIALYKPFNNRPLIDTRAPENIDWYDLVLEGLQQSLPDNPHTLHFKNSVEHQRHNAAL